VWRKLDSDEVRWDVTAWMATSRRDTDMDEAMALTPAERNYIRRELDMFFSTFPTVAEGFQLKTWQGGPHAGQPKLPPAARSLLDRGLVRLDTASRFPRLFFTNPGLAELTGTAPLGTTRPSSFQPRGVTIRPVTPENPEFSTATQDPVEGEPGATAIGETAASTLGSAERARPATKPARS
jgi:hypothetical protein